MFGSGGRLIVWVGTINSDEHSAKRYVRSEREQPLAQEQRDKPGASSYQQGNSGKSKGESVSGAERRGAFFVRDELFQSFF